MFKGLSFASQAGRPASLGRCHIGSMSPTEDQRRASALTGEALLAAQDESLQPLPDRLAAAAEGRDDIRAEVAEAPLPVIG